MHLDVMMGGGDLHTVQRFAQAAQAAGVAGLVFTEAGRTAYLSVAAAALAAPGLDLSTGVAVAVPAQPDGHGADGVGAGRRERRPLPPRPRHAGAHPRRAPLRRPSSTRPAPA